MLHNPRSLWLIAFTLNLLLAACQADKYEKEWKQARTQNDAIAYEGFLTCCEKSSHAPEARRRREDFYWAMADGEKTIYHLLRYSNAFPEGKHREAVNRIFEVIAQDTGLIANETTNTMTRAEELTALIAARFTGTFDIGGQQGQLLSLKFDSYAQSGDTLSLLCTANSGNYRSNLTATFLPQGATLKFTEAADTPLRLGLKEGKLYERKSRLVLESTDPDYYWRLSQ